MDDIPQGPLANLIVAVAGKLLDHPISKGSLLRRDWRRAVGGQLASHTEPIRLQNGILTVRVDSSAWLTELTYLTPEILRKLQNLLPPGSLKGLRFKQESLKTTPAWMSEKKPPQHLPPPLPAEVARAAALTATITDPLVKESLARLLTTDMVIKRLRSTAPAPGSDHSPPPPCGR